MKDTQITRKEQELNVSGGEQGGKTILGLMESGVFDDGMAGQLRYARLCRDIGWDESAEQVAGEAERVIRGSW